MELFYFSYIHTILRPFATNRIEVSENLLFKNDSKVQSEMPKPITIKL